MKIKAYIKINSLKHINNLKHTLKYEDRIFSVSSDFLIKDVAHLELLVKSISELLLTLSKLSDKGYVNNHSIDLPILR